jgi:hypothetical protein
MPALAIYQERKWKVTWLGSPTSGEFKGQRRARLQQVGTGHVEWVDARAIQFIDNPSRSASRDRSKGE